MSAEEQYPDMETYRADNGPEWDSDPYTEWAKEMTKLPPQWTGKLWSIDEAAEILGFSRRQIYNLVREGDLPAYRVGKRIRIAPWEVWKKLEETRIVPETDMTNEEQAN